MRNLILSILICFQDSNQTNFLFKNLKDLLKSYYSLKNAISWTKPQLNCKYCPYFQIGYFKSSEFNKKKSRKCKLKNLPEEIEYAIKDMKLVYLLSEDANSGNIPRTLLINDQKLRLLTFNTTLKGKNSYFLRRMNSDNNQKAQIILTSSRKKIKSEMHDWQDFQNDERGIFAIYELK